MNKDHAELKNPKDLMPFSNLTKGLSDRGPGQSKTKDDSESAEFPLVKSRVTLKMEKMVSNSPKKTSAKIARMDFYSKFLEKSDIISIAIDLLGHEDVFELIHVLYDDLTEPIPSNYRLFKLLVQTEHMNLFEL